METMKSVALSLSLCLVALPSVAQYVYLPNINPALTADQPEHREHNEIECVDVELISFANRG